MAKHPADMKPEERAVWQHGYSHVDTLFRLGYSADDVAFYLQGLRARLEEEQYKALHPGLFVERRST